MKKKPIKPSDCLVKIVQFADEGRLLPDGSKMIYAESDEQLVLYYKKPAQPAKTYVFERKTGRILVNGEEGNPSHKKEMIELGKYLLSHSKDSELVTISVGKAAR